MNWLSDFARPKLKAFFGQRSAPENLWIKCDSCGEMIFHRDVEANQFVCPGCDHHMKVEPATRLASLFDNADYEKISLPDAPVDPLKFKDDKKYTDRLKDARHKTSEQDAIVTGVGQIGGLQTIVCVQNFSFMGGSLGMAAGEAIIKSVETAIEKKTPFVLVASSGGARMQEGILSLMQMPRTTIAVQMLREARLPYIVVLTNPTTGGVTASYGMLGDVHIAEPGALIGFAGPRVIEQTIREKLPESFQTAEYLLEHGMLDMVVHRHDLRPTLGRLLRVLMKQPAVPVERQEIQPAKETASKAKAARSANGKQAPQPAKAKSAKPKPNGAATNGAAEPARPEQAPSSDKAALPPPGEDISDKPTV